MAWGCTEALAIIRAKIFKIWAKYSLQLHSHVSEIGPIFQTEAK